MDADISFGLFLNAGSQIGPSHDAVFDLTIEQAVLAERLGYRDVWVTEHHFIDFGINSNALSLASFLLGRTSTLRVGTAVTLAPQYHPVQLAEQAAILDQASGGRFDFGIGRGGYLRDFQVFGVDTARWDDEIEHTASVLLDAWSGAEVSRETRWHNFTPVRVTPRPRTLPHPPLFMATSTPGAIAFAAARGLPLLHYFATPPDMRMKVEDAYRAALPPGAAPAEHMHGLIAIVHDDEAEARARLHAALEASFRTGDHPNVPQGEGRHKGPDGKPFDRTQMAGLVAAASPVGPPARVAEQINGFIAATGARRLVLYMEAIADRALTLASIERFAAEVRPLIHGRVDFAAAAS